MIILQSGNFYVIKMYMPIYEYPRDSWEFNFVKSTILQKCYDICNQSIDYNYIENSLKLCDFLFVNFELFTLIGFAIVFDKKDELYIDVICNTNKNNKLLHSDLYGMLFNEYRGRDIIDKIKDKGIAMGKIRVGLRALKPVISYYSHLGFTFPYGGHKERRIERIERFRQLMKIYNDLFEKQEKLNIKIENHDYEYTETEREKEIRKELKNVSKQISGELWNFYKRHQSGLHKEPDLRKSLKRGSKYIEKIKVLDDFDSNGIKMIFDLPRERNSYSRKKIKTTIKNVIRRKSTSNNRSRRNITSFITRTNGTAV